MKPPLQGPLNGWAPPVELPAVAVDDAMAGWPLLVLVAVDVDLATAGWPLLLTAVLSDLATEAWSSFLPQPPKPP